MREALGIGAVVPVGVALVDALLTVLAPGLRHLPVVALRHGDLELAVQPTNIGGIGLGQRVRGGGLLVGIGDMGLHGDERLLLLGLRVAAEAADDEVEDDDAEHREGLLHDDSPCCRIVKGHPTWSFRYHFDPKAHKGWLK